MSRSSNLFEVRGVHLPLTSPRNVAFLRILELVNIFAKSHAAFCGRIVLGSRSPHVLYPRILACKDYAHEVHTFGQHLTMDPFFPDF